MGRRYPDKDLKILWGLSAGRCAFPGCREMCIVGSTQYDPRAIIGKIAHIHAHEDRGPRANPALAKTERDSYNNWILLCGTHHDLVDVQPNTYSAADLLKWKDEHEEWVSQRLAKEMPEVTFAELEILLKGILGTASAPSTKFVAPDPREKMKRNSLTDKVLFSLTLGYGKAGEVEDFVEHMALIETNYPERLKTGFVTEYRRLVGKGFNGDSLFESLMEFACGGNQDFRRRAAGLAVLAYLFAKCEVFEEP